jgi:hypothetical protein
MLAGDGCQGVGFQERAWLSKGGDVRHSRAASAHFMTRWAAGRHLRDTQCQVIRTDSDGVVAQTPGAPDLGAYWGKPLWPPLGGSCNGLTSQERV